MYTYIFFDLDGTLIDSGPGIMNAAEYALTHMGIEKIDKDGLSAFVGPPLADSFERFYGLHGEDNSRAVQYYRTYYNEMGGAYESKLYRGVQKVLEMLCKNGKKLAVVTSKGVNGTKLVLEHYGLAKYFECIATANPAEGRLTKADVVAYAMQQCENPKVSDVVMVGDRCFDVEGASCFGIDTIGVCYGYGGKEELTASEATYLVDFPEEIVPIVVR